MADVLMKRIQICQAVGEFKNGSQEGELTLEFFGKLIDRFKEYKKPVPIYNLVGVPDAEHPSDLDEMVPTGWVEGLSIEGDWLMADVKLMGQGAAYVGSDVVRGASIGTKYARTYDGEPIGEVLDHVVLTNNPYIKGMNIAAKSASGEIVAYHFTALEMEATVAEKELKKESKPEDKATVQKAEDADLVAALKSKDDEIVRLKAENLELADKLENATVDEEKHELALRVAKLERKTLAQEVREVCLKMLREGTIKPAKLDGYAKGGDEGTLSWFKASIFKGDMGLLKFAADNNPPLYNVGKTFKSGLPTDDGEKTISAEDRERIRKHGIDPDAVLIAMKSSDLEEFKANIANKEK